MATLCGAFMGFDTSLLTARFDAVCSRLEKAVSCSKTQRPVQLLAVSKKHPAEAVVALALYWKEKHPLAVGTATFGENYVQEALVKQVDVSFLCEEASANWHFIGHIQSRKAKEIAGKFSLIHTVDSIKVATQLQKAIQTLHADAVSTLQKPLAQNILLQVNIGRESQKGGVLPEELESLAKEVTSMPELVIKGLMCMPPYNEEGEASRPYFIKMRHLRDSLEDRLGIAFPELSMGMSHDFTVAVEEGATIVRVGTDIFGTRQT